MKHVASELDLPEPLPKDTTLLELAAHLAAVLFVVALLIALRVEHASVGRRANPLAQAASFQLNPGFDAR